MAFFTRFASALRLQAAVSGLLEPASRRLSLHSLRQALLQEAKQGCRVRCTWAGGVRFRDEQGHKTQLRLAMGEECSVLERQGSWLRSHKGWLPLWGDEEADHEALFEVGA